MSVEIFVRTVKEKDKYAVYLDPKTSIPGEILEIARVTQKEEAIRIGNRLKTVLQKIIDKTTGKVAINPISDVGLR